MIKKMILMGLACSASLSAEVKVLAFSGSTREGSINQKLVVEAANWAKSMGANVTVVNLKDYETPLYTEELEAKFGMPAKAKAFRQLMIDNQVILIASPEYNGSLTGILKNAIDWSSRGESGGGSRDAFKGKKFVLMSASPGGGGGAMGLTQMRAIIEHIGGTVVAKQVVVPDSFNAFDQDGHLKSPQKQAELKQLIQSALSG